MVDSTPLIPDGKEKKEGHRVLCCCDSRKAVIILNLLALALTIASLIIRLVDNQYFSAWTIILYIINLLFYSIVTWSALQFGKSAVEWGIFWSIVDIIWTSVYLARNSGWMVEGSSNRTATIVAYAIFYVFHVLIIYANWTYVSEVGKGIMSRETHSREKCSCCCNV
eukprot:scaffold11048_cov152-Skeletonema_dohrnii-CCMP3373.AAC.4